MGKKKRDIVGQRFGKLIAIEPIKSVKNRIIWRCKCDCGTECNIIVSSLTTGNTKSCGCSIRLKKGEACFNRVYLRYKRNAKIDGRVFELSKEQFKDIVIKDCFYCGGKPNHREIRGSNGSFIHNGIDRKDNNIGYTLSNSLPCCKTCNYAKGTMGFTEFLEWIKRVSLNLDSTHYSRTINSFKDLLNELFYSWEYPCYDLIKDEYGNFELNKLYIAPDHASYKTERWELGPDVFPAVEAFYNFLNKR